MLVLVGGYFWLHGRNRESTDDAQVDGHIAPISAEVSGSVLRSAGGINQHVKAGQVLVRLDPRDYQARVDQAKAAVTVAESQAHAAQVGVPLTRATTASGTSGAAGAGRGRPSRVRPGASGGPAGVQPPGSPWRRPMCAQAEANNRQCAGRSGAHAPADGEAGNFAAAVRRLRGGGAGGGRALRAAQEQLNAARQTAAEHSRPPRRRAGAVEQARAGLAGIARQPAAGERQRGAGEIGDAGIQQARANLAAAELNLSYTTIVAPMDGVVTQQERGAGPDRAAGPGV